MFATGQGSLLGWGFPYAFVEGFGISGVYDNHVRAKHFPRVLRLDTL